MVLKALGPQEGGTKVSLPTAGEDEPELLTSHAVLAWRSLPAALQRLRPAEPAHPEMLAPLLHKLCILQKKLTTSTHVIFFFFLANEAFPLKLG